MNACAAIPESALDPVPAFHVEAPNGRKDWPEIDRQATFFQILRIAGPQVLAYANANAGKRARFVARKEGILSGVFDVTCVYRDRIAWIEFKGYDSRGRAGQLTDNQITFGNRLIDMGLPAACFFDPYNAAGWLRDQGFPLGSFRHAA